MDPQIRCAGPKPDRRRRLKTSETRNERAWTLGRLPFQRATNRGILLHRRDVVKALGGGRPGAKMIGRAPESSTKEHAPKSRLRHDGRPLSLAVSRNAFHKGQLASIDFCPFWSAAKRSKRTFCPIKGLPRSTEGGSPQRRRGSPTGMARVRLAKLTGMSRGSYDRAKPRPCSLNGCATQSIPLYCTCVSSLAPAPLERQGAGAQGRCDTCEVLAVAASPGAP